jgi:ACS family hexuronate transporter-like MFS transporter
MAMLICAVSVTPIIIATQHVSLWVAVGLLGLATAAHQGWSANIFTTASDMFPRKVVGSVVGFGGMAGSVGGMIFSASAGFILEFTGSYYSLFFIAGSAYLLALAIFQFIVPNITAKDMESIKA